VGVGVGRGAGGVGGGGGGVGVTGGGVGGAVGGGVGATGGGVGGDGGVGAGGAGVGAPLQQFTSEPMHPVFENCDAGEQDPGKALPGFLHGPCVPAIQCAQPEPSARHW
jgi:hypothetical protein